MDKNQILEKLKTVNYPGFNRDIVSFGMIKDIVIDHKTITLFLSISSSNNKKKDQLISEIHKTLDNTDYDIKIKILDSAPRKTVDTSNKDRNVEGNIKKIIAIASGKGGVGKSTIALNLAAALSNAGCKTGLLDLDIYGPSLPITMGINENPEVNDSKKIIPLEKNNLKLMSFGFISGNQAPVVWRGPLVAKMTEQFFRDVVWGDLDYLILDLPPGTGDVQLTLSQKIPLDGVIIVTTPNDIALADVRKGADMFRKVKTDLLGVVENMSYMNIKGVAVNSADSHIVVNDEKILVGKDGSFQLKFHLFKKGGGLDESKRLNIPFLAEIPYSNDLMKSIDDGNPIVFQEKDSEIKNIFVDLAKKICEMIDVNYTGLIEESEERLGKDQSYMLNSDKIRKELGWKDTIDLEDGNFHKVTLTANCTFTFSNVPATANTAASFTLFLVQDGTGSRTVTWPGSVDWAAATAPTLTTTAAAVDVLTFITLDGGTIWNGFVAGQAMG